MTNSQQVLPHIRLSDYNLGDKLKLNTDLTNVGLRKNQIVSLHIRSHATNQAAYFKVGHCDLPHVFIHETALVSLHHIDEEDADNPETPEVFEVGKVYEFSNSKHFTYPVEAPLVNNLNTHENFRRGKDCIGFPFVALLIGGTLTKFKYCRELTRHTVLTDKGKFSVNAKLYHKITSSDEA